MKASNVSVVLILILSAVLFSVGVVKKIAFTQQDKKVIAVIPKGTASMWWEVVHKGANQAGDETGYEILWTGPEQETDRQKQIFAVDDVVVKQVDALVLGPNDAKALARPVLKVKQAGIPCVIIDSAVEGDPENYVSFVATDNLAGGAAAARRLGATLSGRGNVIITKFVQNSASTDARAKGFKDTLAKEFPNIKIVDEQYSLGTVEDSRQKTVDMLTRNPNVQGLFAVNHPASVGAYKALQTQKLAGKVKMVGFDSDPILLEGIADGGVDALVVQNPFDIGYYGVMVAVDAIAGKETPKNKPIDSMLVEKSNLEEMKAKFPAALGL